MVVVFRYDLLSPFLQDRKQDKHHHGHCFILTGLPRTQMDPGS